MKTKQQRQFCRGAITALALLVISTVFPSSGVYAQRWDSSAFSQPIMIDEVVVSARQHGFDIPQFIDLIKNDTTFYKAFKTMHLKTYNAENDIKIFSGPSRRRIKARLQSETKQVYRHGCRTMNVLEEQVSGNFYKRNGKMRYYTAALFDEVFFTHGKVCGENNIVAGELDGQSLRGNRIEKSKIQLKYLIFNPGRAVPGVPVVGKKVAIFDPDIARMYDFKLVAEEKMGMPCYLFEARPKPGYQDDVVIKVFRTWLRQSDYAMVARDYALSYNTLVFDFDVQMRVRLSKIGGQLLPTYIDYRGNWHILTQDREVAAFTAKFDY